MIQIVAHRFTAKAGWEYLLRPVGQDGPSVWMPANAINRDELDAESYAKLYGHSLSTSIPAIVGSLMLILLAVVLLASVVVFAISQWANLWPGFPGL